MTENRFHLLGVHNAIRNDTSFPNLHLQTLSKGFLFLSKDEHFNFKVWKHSHVDLQAFLHVKIYMLRSTTNCNW